MPKINFILNGKPVTASYEPGMTFLEVLREECGITSAKNGCSPEGACGCCAVLFDGRPALSCLRKPEQMEGHEVETLEGHAGGDAQVAGRRLHSWKAECSAAFASRGFWCARRIWYVKERRKIATRSRRR